jgi:hypothetical protein
MDSIRGMVEDFYIPWLITDPLVAAWKPSDYFKAESVAAGFHEYLHFVGIYVCYGLGYPLRAGNQVGIQYSMSVICQTGGFAQYMYIAVNLAEYVTQWAQIDLLALHARSAAVGLSLGSVMLLRVVVIADLRREVLRSMRGDGLIVPAFHQKTVRRVWREHIKRLIAEYHQPGIQLSTALLAKLKDLEDDS